MNEESRRIILDVAKHLVTVAIASIGFLITLMFTTFEGTPYTLSGQISLFSLLISTIFCMLTQLAVVDDSLSEKTFIEWLKWSPKTLLLIAWVFLISGITAFVVFTVANI